MAPLNYPQITLKKGREAALLRGHPWMFSGAIAAVTGAPGVGDVVLAKDSAGRPLALGFFNPRTDIAFRALTTNTDTIISADFWHKRLQTACNLRQKIITPRTNAYRLINAEGDGFPGLIVDVYDTTLVLSITTAGMEKQKKYIIDALIAELKPAVIYEQSQGRSRILEGLENNVCFLRGEDQSGIAEITENGLKFAVDFIGGQKTGFFLDQRINREKIGALSCNAQVLNCFSYTGAFSVYCAAGGAKSVVSLDISKTACKAARKNLHRNGYSSELHSVVETDVFTYLRNSQEDFDLIILDPPAFAKTKKDIAKASRGYKEINLQALKRLVPGGILATFSCSNFIEEELFSKIILGAARDAGIDLRLLARLEAGPDHPIGAGHPEGRYLKGLLLAAL
ncbi:MAG: 23S rRNA (cytosine(1962)-C(5))-methyltransferase RlmI [Deltaproteobacteria bacterium HGW-Deltaproteobacteria-10]|nr:MAG: 23S rRNA (cytosine(1962)-C(5))-methyltransferase RlmI [Deltaproteobacteria bacterium HGW-Deltaproteobacteria-10]